SGLGSELGLWAGGSGLGSEPAGGLTPSSLQVLRVLAGKVVVGHAIHNDFKALHYSHPKALTRDTSHIPLLNRRAGFPENVSISLKRLTKALLNQDIQVGKSGHSSVEDAQATMELYKVVEEEWEQHLQSLCKVPTLLLQQLSSVVEFRLPHRARGGANPVVGSIIAPFAFLNPPGCPRNDPNALGGITSRRRRTALP
uniref:Exonuclease domain-containing protein n=1 Tax=Ficedula albicollis TaxID=59894 RepID=A0A803V7C1_FICAL